MDLFVSGIIESVKLCGDPMLWLLLIGGSIWGAIVGALPGVGSTLGIGIILPFTFQMSPVYAIAMTMSINVANSFGNSIPAILMGVPGSSSAVLTAVDGYMLHKQGKSGLALGVTYYASCLGQFLSIFFFLAMVVPLSGLAYVFLAPEMAALYFLGIITVISISGDNIMKGILAAVFGLAISLIGPDPVNAVNRFVFAPKMRYGLDPIPVVMGVLAMSELFRSMRQTFQWSELVGSFEAKFPTMADFKRATPRILIGTLLGSTMGAIPGLTGTASAFISYSQSKLWSKHPEEYGHGSIEGIAANESAQNAAQAGEMVPTFGLGIPSGGTMVMVLAACLIHGFIPGPNMIRLAPQLLYAASGGMFMSTIILVVLGWPMSIYTLKLMSLNRQLILLGCIWLTLIGTFTLANSVWDVFILILFGIIGYWMRRYGYPVAGTSIAVILGPGLEANLRRGILMMNDDWWGFFTRPWTAAITVAALGFLIYGTYGTIVLARRAAVIRRKAVALQKEKLSASN